MTLSGGDGKPLVLTLGEPAGIGGEIVLKAWLRRAEGLPTFLSIDDPGRLQRLAERLGLEVAVRAINAPEEAASVFCESLPVLPQALGAEPVPGKLDPANAEAVRSSIETAVSLVGCGRASAVVTIPIHKQCLYQAGFPFPGHTEFLADLAKISTPPVMMLVCPELRVAPVTVHLGLGEAIRSLKTADIVEKAVICEAALRNDFAISKPRLAVAGLNPHAGEGGSMGDEEQTIIGPAVQQLRDKGIHAFGPEPADTLFDANGRKNYDAAICMYHDQALIPIKTIAFDHAVNVTLGLPFVRTSPDHGTALNIAGAGKADETSLIAAMRLAAEMAARRAGGG